MERARFSNRGLVLLTGVGLALAIPAIADEGHSGNASVPKYSSYPRGRSVTQSYVSPAQGVSTLEAFNAAPGAITPSASMSALYQQPTTRKLVVAKCMPLFRSSSQFRVGSGEAALVAGPQAIHKFSYGLQYNDVPFSRHTSQSMVILARGNQRRLLFTRDRNLPDPASLPADTTATVKLEDAQALGMADAKQALGDVALEFSRAEVNEAPHLEMIVLDQQKPALAWTFVVRGPDRKSRFARQYWVAAQGNARLLSKEDLVYQCAPQVEAAAGGTAAKGRISGTIFGFKKSPLDPPDANQPLQDYQVESFGGMPVITDVNGQYAPHPGVSVSRVLIGPFVRVINDGGPALAPAADGNNLVFAATGEQDVAQVSAFYWVNLAHEFVRPFLPGSPTRLQNNEVHVNINDTCNAFWNSLDNSLNFFKSGGGCVNSAYCDVACHEFGHGVDAEFGDILDGGYSEGFGDSLAILITHDSVIGRDFLGRGMHLRNAADKILWPDVKDDFDPHVVGQPYAGFTWELTRQLLNKFGGDEKQAFDAAKELTLGAAALNPRDVPDAVRLVFFVDHQNGSRFFQEIANAADSRKIPRPQSSSELNDPASLNVAAK